MRSLTMPTMLTALLCSACAVSMRPLPVTEAKVPGAAVGTSALALAVSGHGSLLVSPTQDVCVGTGCVYEVQTGAQLTLEARADPQHRFVRWEGGCTGTATSCELSLERSEVVAAIFEPNLQAAAAPATAEAVAVSQ